MSTKEDMHRLSDEAGNLAIAVDELLTHLKSQAAIVVKTRNNQELAEALMSAYDMLTDVEEALRKASRWTTSGEVHHGRRFVIPIADRTERLNR